MSIGRPIADDRRQAMLISEDLAVALHSAIGGGQPTADPDQ
jgi:hypothetical protein